MLDPIAAVTEAGHPKQMVTSSSTYHCHFIVFDQSMSMTGFTWLLNSWNSAPKLHHTTVTCKSSDTNEAKEDLIRVPQVLKSIGLGNLKISHSLWTISINKIQIMEGIALQKSSQCIIASHVLSFQTFFEIWVSSIIAERIHLIQFLPLSNLMTSGRWLKLLGHHFL